MEKEIQQPDIKKPVFGYEIQLSEPFTFYYDLGTARVTWLRFVAPQLGIDSDRYILGEILGNIQGDDDYFFRGKERVWKGDSEMANIARDQLMGRIQWKLEAPETPTEINEKLKILKITLKDLDWVTEENYQLAKDMWRKIQKLVANGRENRSEWDDAVKYSFEADKMWRPKGLPYYWEAFMSGELPLIELYEDVGE